MNTKIKKAVKILKKGGLVAFPTETVYGLGARLFDPIALGRIFELKGRPQDNPLIVHISSLDQVFLLTQKPLEPAFDLMRKYWPGPLTLVFKKSSLVPKEATAGLDTVALRMPGHPLAFNLLKSLGEPIAAPSANRSGRPSSTKSRHVMKEFGKNVELILAGDEPDFGIESTVLDVTRRPFRILRPGFVTVEDLRSVVPNVVPFSKERQGKSGLVRSPGTKHRHYVPSCKVMIVHPKKWDKTLSDLTSRNLKLGILSYSQKVPFGRNIVLRRTFRKNKTEYARKLYSCFYEAEEKAQVLVVESVDTKGVGSAVMDRLFRASA